MKKVSIFLFFLLLFATGAVAWGPSTELFILDKALKQSNSEFSKICIDNIEYCEQGLVLAHLGKMYYYNAIRIYSRYTDYDFLIKELELASNDKEKACVIGALGHLASENAFNLYVSNKIKSSGIHDWIIHSGTELKTEKEYFNIENRDVLDNAEKMCLPLFEKATGKDWTTDYQILKSSLDTPVDYYDDAFGISGKDTFNSRTYRYLAKTLRPFISSDDNEDYINKSISNAIDVLNGKKIDLDRNSIIQANESIMVVNYVILGIVAIMWFYLTKKWKWW